MTDRRNDSSLAAVIVGSVVVAIGAWLLLGRLLGFAPLWFARYVRIALSALGPLALIGLGVLVIVAAQRGYFSSKNFAGKRFRRSRTDRMLGGVLGGLAAYLEVDSTLLRLGYVLLAIATGFGLAVIAYIVAIIVVPEEPLDATVTSERQAPPPPPAP